MIRCTICGKPVKQCICGYMKHLNVDIEEPIEIEEPKEFEIETDKTKLAKQLEELSVKELKEKCKELGLVGYSKKKEQELISMILETA